MIVGRFFIFNIVFYITCGMSTLSFAGEMVDYCSSVSSESLLYKNVNVSNVYYTDNGEINVKLTPKRWVNIPDDPKNNYIVEFVLAAYKDKKSMSVCVTIPQEGSVSKIKAVGGSL